MFGTFTCLVRGTCSCALLDNSFSLVSYRPVATRVAPVSSSHRRYWRWQQGCTSSAAPGILSFSWTSLEYRGTECWKMVWSLPATCVTLPCLVPAQNLMVFGSSDSVKTCGKDSEHRGKTSHSGIRQLIKILTAASQFWVFVQTDSSRGACVKIYHCVWCLV